MRVQGIREWWGLGPFKRAVTSNLVLIDVLKHVDLQSANFPGFKQKLTIRVT